MSDQPLFALVPIEVFLTRDLTLEELRVIGALLSFRGKNTDVVWPGREKLAERCGYAPNKISHVTTKLAAKGWLIKEGSGGRSRPCCYRVTIPETVSHSETVSESETVSHSEPKTLSDSETKTVSHSERGIEQTKEQTKEQTNKKACAKNVTGNGSEKPVSTPPFDPLRMVLPEWLDPEDWALWVRHRRRLKRPLDEDSAPLNVKRLAKLLAAGHAPSDVIHEASERGWQGLYPPKTENQHETLQRVRDAQAIERANKEAIDHNLILYAQRAC